MDLQMCGIKFDQIRKESNEHNCVVKRPNNFAHIELNEGDGVRIFLDTLISLIYLRTEISGYIIKMLSFFKIGKRLR